ncbi:MAG: type II secretion system protein [Chthoniobacterales bacterium]
MEYNGYDDGNRRAFTLLEILAVIALIAILGTLSYGALHDSVERAQQIRCAGNLQQLGTALAFYMQDHDGRIPRRGQGVQPVVIINRPDDWFNCLPPYLGQQSYQDLVTANRAPKAGDKSVFVCPSAVDLGKPYFLAYGMNMYLSPWIRPDMHHLREIPHPYQLAFLADGPGGWSSTLPSNQAYSVLARHHGCANILFVDAHVQSFSGSYLGCQVGNSTLPDVRWDTETDGVNQTHMP